MDSTLGPTVTDFCRNALPLLHGAIRGKRMIETIDAIQQADRWNNFDRWHDTSRYLVERYGSAGAKAQVYSAPTGGPTGNGRWIIHEAADVRMATLDVVAPVQQRLADWQQNPWHIIQWSAATPAGGVICPLVVIDEEAHLNRLRPGSLRGKMVLTKLSAWDLRVRFVEKGAYGIISDAGVKDCPDAVGWVKFGWGGLDLRTTTARLTGFALSHNQGQALRGLIQQHKQLSVRVEIDIHRYAGSHDVVSGLVLGRDDPGSEVWALAHSAEPGALDNASGLAACVEIAQVLEELIRSGQLARPRRTIRLLTGYECYGFFHYLEHERRFQTPLAGACIDTIGAKPQFCDGHLRWHATIPPSAGFVNDLGAQFIRAALDLDNPGYAFEEMPFVTTEDTLLGDPKYGFPCPWLTNHPFKGYHSNADTLELLDERGLAMCTAAMAGYLYYLADMGTNEATELASSQTRKTVVQLSSNPAWSPGQRNYARVQHAIALEQLERWWWSGEHRELVEQFGAMTAEVESMGRGGNPSAPPPPASADLDLVPLRKVPLAPTGENVFPPLSEQVGLRWAHYWADGQRSIGEIVELFSLEPNRKSAVPAERVVSFFKALERLGYVQLTAAEQLITEERLIADLHQLGVQAGMDLVVHSALSKVGHVKGGPAAVVNAVVRAVGPEGTVLFPSFNHFITEVFNPLATPTTNGAIPDAAWRRADAVRSVQGSHAVTAIGPRAAFYTEGHLQHGIWGTQSPLGRLVESGGYILGLGVSNDASTIMHVAEIAENAPCIDQFASIDRIVLSDGTVKDVPGLSWRGGNCPAPTRALDETLDARKLQTHGKVGLADGFLVRARDLWSVRREHIHPLCPTCPVRPEHRRPT